jgi:recombination protein RecR
MYEGLIQDLIDELGRLPGIGPKSAQRIAFFIVQDEHYDPSRLATILAAVREHVHFCSVCGNLTEQEQCSVCTDPRRDRSVICVVEEPKDVAAIERTHEYHGLYHVLGGAISPIDGTVKEIIIATDPNLEGEATATYLARQLGYLDVKVTRLASGLPVGGDLEYADEVTLGRAFEGRRAI